MISSCPSSESGESQSKVNIIAIDGPAAAGKSTVGFEVAQRLDFLFFDTGIMYRAVTWAILERGIDAAASAEVGRIAESLPIEIHPPQSNQLAGATSRLSDIVAPFNSDGRQPTVRLGDQDITWAIRTPQVDQNVSTVAANAQVRLALSRHQRRIGLMHGSGSGEKAGIVMVGRDIGTVVLPEAPLKIYLSAPVEERARRRHQELVAQGKIGRRNDARQLGGCAGQQADFTQILSDMRRRDAIDSQRAIAPLRPADDAYLIQTVGSSIKQIVDQILSLARRQLGVQKRGEREEE